MDENSVINSAFGVNIIGKTLTEILLITYTGVGIRVIDLKKIAGVMNKSLFGRTFTDQYQFQYKFAGIKLAGSLFSRWGNRVRLVTGRTLSSVSH